MGTLRGQIAWGVWWEGGKSAVKMQQMIEENKQTFNVKKNKIVYIQNGD